ncbi:hypothetical protein L5515_006145 [Caenorhabditis briggsae]|uniref:Uncharacterized protein n=1 Tax=Caenorhabditis briggsae TaxID=6238 RepID=A0AAE9EZV5_CAEBR|nr:hypothetical protein L5515_006145 [Caenorhabditis briggsae]
MFSFKASLLLLVILSVVVCDYQKSEVFKFPDALCDYTNDSVTFMKSSVFKFPNNHCDYTNEYKEGGDASSSGEQSNIKLVASADQMVETRRM